MILLKNLLLTFGVEHFVLLWPGSSAVNPLEREHQMTNTPGSCWVFICHICLCDKAFPAGREGHLTGLPCMWPTDRYVPYITQNQLSWSHWQCPSSISVERMAMLGHIRLSESHRGLIDIVWRETPASTSSQRASKSGDKRLYVDKWIKLPNLTRETGHPWQSLCCV